MAKATSWNRDSFAWSIIIASVVLLVLVGVAGFRWAHSNLSLRLFAGVVAVVSLVVGVLSLPVKPIRSSQVADNAGPAAGRVPAVFESEAPETAGADVAVAREELDAAQLEDLVSQPGDLFGSSAGEAMPMETVAPSVEAEIAPLKEAAKGAARFAQSEHRRRQTLDAATGDKAEDLLRKKEKKSLMLSRDAQAATAAASTPETPRPTANAPSPRSSVTRQPSAFDDAVDSELLTREYATWFYRARRSLQPTGDSPPTIVWLPHHDAESGTASVYFDLPQRPASFRAIVEAHEAGRLGSGELLIESR